MKNRIFVLIAVLCISLFSETLFEVKDASNNTVFNISEDGLRVFNLGDTLMVISANAIRANISSSKGLSRSFSVTTTSSVKGKGLINALEVGANSTTMSAPDGEYTDFSPDNIFLGFNAGSNTNPDTLAAQGVNNVFIGNNAGFTNSGGYENIFIGFNAGYNNTIGTKSTAVGDYSLYSNTWGSENTALGFHSLYNNTQGQRNTALGDNSLYYNVNGKYNTSVGMYSGWGNISGQYNTSLGYQSYNYGAGVGAHTYCTFLGNNANTPNVSTLTNSTAIGNESSITGSDQVRIGNSSVTSIGGYSGWTTLTKKKYAKNITDDIIGLEFITKLKPVSYNLDVNQIKSDLKIEDYTDEINIKKSIDRSSSLRRSGFIPEDVLKAAQECGYEFTGLDMPENEDDQFGLRYAEFVIPLIKAVQEQQEQIEQLKKEISELKK